MNRSSAVKTAGTPVFLSVKQRTGAIIVSTGGTYMGMFLTDEGCRAQRAYVNLSAWDRYDGSGIVIFCDDADDNHAECVQDIIATILPKATIYTGSIGYLSNGGMISDVSVSLRETQEFILFDKFIRKYGVSMINNSTDGGAGNTVLPIAEWMSGKIKQYNLIMTGAAGNGGPTTQRFSGACMVVTSALLKNGKAVTSIGSVGSNIDFAMFNGFQPGTSFASPFLLGMAGKLRCRYPYITQDEVRAYFKAHCEALSARRI